MSGFLPNSKERGCTLPEQCLGCPRQSQLCSRGRLLLLRKKTYYKPVSSCVRALRSSLGRSGVGVLAVVQDRPVCMPLQRSSASAGWDPAGTTAWAAVSGSRSHPAKWEGWEVFSSSSRVLPGEYSNVWGVLFPLISSPWEST